MRLPLLLALALMSPAFASAHGEFEGAWVAAICPSGADRNAGECANFVLELMEKDGKLCGAHMFATAGAARIDEGTAPSLTADIADGAATGIAVSSLTPTPIRMRITLTLDKGTLRWKRLDSPSGDTLLPLNARLVKARSRTLFAPLFEQELRAACTYVFNLAALARPGIAGEGGAQAMQADSDRASGENASVPSR